MAFKYSIGQAVEYTPMRQSAGLFEVIRHMPEEDGAGDRKYRIKSLMEGFERTVNEFDLQHLRNAVGPLRVRESRKLLVRRQQKPLRVEHEDRRRCRQQKLLLEGLFWRDHCGVLGPCH